MVPDREKVLKGLEICAEKGAWHGLDCSRNKAYKDCPYYLCETGCVVTIARDAIATLKEQEQVVRCKDCKHWNEETAEIDYDFGCRTAVCGLLSDIDTWGEIPEACFHRSEDFFCADGERRDTDA